MPPEMRLLAKLRPGHHETGRGQGMIADERHNQTGDQNPSRDHNQIAKPEKIYDRSEKRKTGGEKAVTGHKPTPQGDGERDYAVEGRLRGIRIDRDISNKGSLTGLALIARIASDASIARITSKKYWLMLRIFIWRLGWMRKKSTGTSTSPPRRGER